MQFKDIQGQRVLINHLTEIIDSGRVSHAQLFLGGTESGSLQLAVAYAQYLFCENRQHYGEGSELRADSCGECPNCKKFRQLMHSDLHFIFPNAATKKGEKNPSSALFQEEFRNFLLENNMLASLNDWYNYLGLDNKQGLIREADASEVVRLLNLKSYEGGDKVLVMWKAEKMNNSAANTLLKTLEEPTPGTVILLVAESTDDLLQTILSRVQIVSVPDIAEVHNNPQYAELFVSWMRLLFRLKMQSLSEKVDQIAALNREQQKEFLLYTLDVIRDCFLKTAAGVECHLNSGDEKFDAAFPSMITQRNIERMNEAINKTIYAIERNAYGKIALMKLSFTLSSLIKNR